MTLISDTSSLQSLCARLTEETFVTVDTEFMRDKTYYPELCLVQLGGTDYEAAVDTLADGLELSPLFELMANPNVLKVFHAARQDLEIFVHLAGTVPAPVFDTQVAAMVCGYGDSVSYDRLVRSITGAKLDKSARFTNWKHRPLSQQQLDYAIGDVTHLRDVYRALNKRLEKTNRSSWLTDEMEALTSPETYEANPADAWRRFKSKNTKPKYHALLCALAAWREQQAQRKNTPRARVIRDDAITELAAQAPTTPDELARTRSFNKGAAEGKLGRELLKVITTALEAPKEDWPQVPELAPQSNGREPVVELLRVLLKIKCDEFDVAPKLLASSSDLDAIAGDDEADVPALKGWRREVFGEDAIRLKHGKIGMTFSPEKDALTLINVAD